MYTCERSSLPDFKQFKFVIKFRFILKFFSKKIKKIQRRGQKEDRKKSNCCEPYERIMKLVSLPFIKFILKRRQIEAKKRKIDKKLNHIGSKETEKSGKIPEQKKN